MSKHKIVTICSSASFYKEVINFESQLKKLGFKVIIPQTAHRMKQSGDFDISKVKTWDNNPKDFHKKTKLMRGHFQEVARGDIVLVINLEKHGVKGYIGGNVLMEMAVAFFLKKKIYILNQVNKDAQFYEEIIGLGSIILDGDLKNIKRQGWLVSR